MADVVNMKNKPIKYEFHRFCTAFPRLQGEDYIKLKEDIKQNGQKLPILIYDNKILDGVGRYNACNELKIAPIFDDAGGEDDEAALKLLVSLNLVRRHLTEAQKAFAAAEIATMNVGLNKQRGGADLITQEEAATLVGSSVTSLQRVKTIKKYGTPELVKEVQSGKKSLKEAAAEARDIRATYAGSSLANRRKKKAEKSSNTSREVFETKNSGSLTGVASQSKKRLAADRYVSVEEIRFKLLPFVEKLIKEGKMGKVKISPAAVIIDATEIKQIIESW